MSSALSFTFRPSLIPAYAQAEFLTRFCQLVLDYETLTSPVPEAPPAEQIPAPSAFVPVDGDAPVSKKPRKNAWADLTEEQRTERVAKMRAGRAAKAAERRVSEDSLNVPAPTETGVAVGSDGVPLVPVRTPNNGGVNVGLTGTLVADDAPAPAPAPAEDTASETSSKKQRKNPWADLTEEQRAAKIAKMRAGREAKKAAAATGSA